MVVAALCCGLASVAQAAVVVWVDGHYTSGSRGGHTWGGDAFPSMHAGLAAVDVGGAVHAAPGRYVENPYV